jgi:hypothetical protein
MNQQRVVCPKRERLGTRRVEGGKRAGAGHRVALSQVHRHCNDFVPFENQALEEHGRVEPTRIGEDDATHAAF